jgi:hypothetical protein
MRLLHFSVAFELHFRDVLCRVSGQEGSQKLPRRMKTHEGRYHDRHAASGHRVARLYETACRTHKEGEKCNH